MAISAETVRYIKLETFKCIFLAAFFLNGTVLAVAQSHGGELRGSALSLVPRGSKQPSFDCEKAKTAAARLICADAELARLDGELGDIFRKQKALIPAADQSKFVASQTAWIRKRNENCALKGKDAAAVEALADLKPCVASALRERIDFLSQSDRANMPTTSDLPLLQTVRGRCSQNYCMWMRLTAQTVVGTDASGGRLVRSMIESAETEYLDENQPPPKTISWGKPFESYALCSRTKPAIINQWKGWSAVLLAPGYPEKVSGSIEGSLIEYFLVCHGLTNVDIRDPSLAVRYGYPADIAKRVGTVALAVPTDIMDSEARDGAIFVQISVTATLTTPPVIMGTTNLPDGAKLIVNLRGDPPACLPKCMWGFGEVTVEGGRFTATSAISPKISGYYTVEITMGVAFTQPENVQAVIGKHGENLRGPLIVILDENGNYTPLKFPRSPRPSYLEPFIRFTQRIKVAGDPSSDIAAKARAIAE